MTAFDAVVVGGGVAGLSVLAQLSSDGRALLLEREPLLAAHASGRNAAIYRPLEDEASTVPLARRSLALLAELCAEPLLARTGLLLAAGDRARALTLVARGRAQGLACELLEGTALHAAASSLGGSEVAAAAYVPEGGVLDIHGMTTALARAARARGAQIREGAAVARVLVSEARVRGVELSDGTRLPAGAVVLAAGAWGGELGAACGAPLPLSPVRRHLVQLEPEVALSAGHPVVWRVDDEVYYRPESGGVLASPCDATASGPCVPAADPAVLELLARKLARTAPQIAGAKVRAAWACLRTFAPDRELCVGEDPRVRGLYWLAGLGGRGMAVAPAAGELLAACTRGERHELAQALSPARLL